MDQYNSQMLFHYSEGVWLTRKYSHQANTKIGEPLGEQVLEVFLHKLPNGIDFKIQDPKSNEKMVLNNGPPNERIRRSRAMP